MKLIHAVAFLAATPTLTFIPSGMTRLMGGYRPVRAEMSSINPGLRKIPAGLQAPMFGKLKVGEQEFAFILDEPSDSASKLFVDTNGDGDLTNDPATNWKVREQNGQNGAAMYMGWAQVTLEGQLASIGVYRFDKKDPQRAALKNILLYYPDFGFQGKLTIGADTFPIAFAGAISSDAQIWVDRNGNGKNDGRSETIYGYKPFNFSGTTYEVRFEGGSLNLARSAIKVAEFPFPPDLAVGNQAPRFEAISTDGSGIAFPESFKGKIVLLDFWATWSATALAEIPTAVKAYENFHSRGLEVIGISFDQANQAEKIKSVTKEKGMLWKLIYEGNYWDTALGLKFGVETVPFRLLVDGNTGKILASGDRLRGEALEKTLKEALAKH
jgi:thiol-disulfide isomerase/thioredoxin